MSKYLATTIECFFKWPWRPLVEPLVVLIKVEQMLHLAVSVSRLSLKWNHTFDLNLSETSSNAFWSPWSRSCSNRKYFLDPKSKFEIFKNYHNKKSKPLHTIDTTSLTNGCLLTNEQLSNTNHTSWKFTLIQRYR